MTKSKPQQTIKSAVHPSGEELTLARQGDGPDPRLIELVRLLARRAARTYYEEQLRNRATSRS